MERIVKGDVIEINLRTLRGMKTVRPASGPHILGKVVDMWTLKAHGSSQKVITIENEMSRWTVTPKEIVRKLSTLERSLMNL